MRGNGDWRRQSPQPRRETTPLYTFRRRGVRTFMNNGATESTYEIKFKDNLNATKLVDMYDTLRQIFNRVIDHAAGHLPREDLGRVVIFHEGLHDPIVAPLQPLGTLDADAVLLYIQNMLNSNQELLLNGSFQIPLGTIEFPKGGLHITKLSGHNNSVLRKKSMVHE